MSGENATQKKTKKSLRIEKKKKRSEKAQKEKKERAWAMDMTNPEPFDYEQQELYLHPYVALAIYLIVAGVILVVWCRFGDSRQGAIIGLFVWVLYCVPGGFSLFEFFPAQRASNCNEWKLRYLNLGYPEFSAAVLLDKKRALLKEIRHDNQILKPQAIIPRIITVASSMAGILSIAIKLIQLIRTIARM